jgi:predicted TIM-barrel fold metal-dependent hydrolase
VEPLTVISSDGHAAALMQDYRPYLDPEFREEFDAFLIEWDRAGSRSIDPPALHARMDPEDIADWTRLMVDTGRVDGYPFADRRLVELDREGIAAEVLFPDFGLPFELYSRSLASSLGYPELDPAHKNAGYRAFNRWVLDFMSIDPTRFVGMAAVSWQLGVDNAIDEIEWAHRNGFRGVVLPEFDPRMPLYHPDYEPIWNKIDELGMIVNSHSGFSSTSNHVIYTPGVPHPACAIRIWKPEFFFFLRNILSHLIWGGVLERHPDITVVLTEQNTSWVPPTLAEMDYAYSGSYFRTDIRDVIPLTPSEYFERQVYMGSSLFSKAEVEQRHEVGLGKMMLGMDFPHHEGTLLVSTSAYLQATLGAAHVPLEEAKMLLSENAARIFGFDLERLRPIADKIGPSVDDVLTPPEEDLFPKGDVHRPV